MGMRLGVVGVWVLAGVVGWGQAAPKLPEGSSAEVRRPAITGVAFARVYAADGAATERFYGTLGLRREVVRGVATYPVNALQWVEVAPLPVHAPRARLAAVGFTTRDAAGLLRYLEMKGFPATEPLVDGRFGVRDPEGNLIEFVEMGSEKVAPPPENAASRRIIHAGFAVKNSEAEDRFYRGVLGFSPLWHGGMTPERTDWMSLQVPEGTDWLEYMLNVPKDADLHQMGGADHFSLGVAHMEDAARALGRNGCEGPNCGKMQMGRDGKIQLNVYDPDLTRVEFMEFVPRGTPCCAPITGRVPGEVEDR